MLVPGTVIILAFPVLNKPIIFSVLIPEYFISSDFTDPEACRKKAEVRVWRDEYRATNNSAARQEEEGDVQGHISRFIPTDLTSRL